MQPIEDVLGKQDMGNHKFSLVSYEDIIIFPPSDKQDSSVHLGRGGEEVPWHITENYIVH